MRIQLFFRYPMWMRQIRAGGWTDEKGSNYSDGDLPVPLHTRCGRGCADRYFVRYAAEHHQHDSTGYPHGHDTIRTCTGELTYKLVLVLLGLFVLFFQPRITDTYMQNVMPVMWLGLWLNVFCVTFMLLLTFHPQLMRQILVKGHDVLVKMHILKKKTSRLEKLEGAMDEYQKTAEYLKNHPGVVGIVFLITCLQRVALFFVTYFVYRSFGLHQYSMYDIVILQGMISVAVDMLPLPGGMGISEKLFSMLFTGIFGQVKVLAGLILSRGLSYYTELLISAVMTVAAQLFLGNEKEHREKINEKLKTIQEKGKGYERKRGNS